MGDIPNPNATPPPSTPPPGANIGIISRVANIGRTMYRVTRGTAALIGNLCVMGSNDPWYRHNCCWIWVSCN